MYHRTYRRETWLFVCFLLILWGIYSIEYGSLSSSLDDSSGEKYNGLAVQFVWAYPTSVARFISIAAFVFYVLLAYLLLKYQRDLQLRVSFLFTVLVSIVLLAW